MGSAYVGRKVKVEIPFPPTVQATVKSEPITYAVDEDYGDKKRKRDSDDLVICDLTLKELQKRCRKKKKKVPKSGNLTKQDIMTGFSLDNDQCYASSQMEDVSDLEQPLCILKRKLSNKARSKRKSIKKHATLSSESGVSVEAAIEDITKASEYSLRKASVIHEPANIEVQISEIDSSNCQNMVFVSNDTDREYHFRKSFCWEMSDEMPMGVNTGDLETGESLSFTTEPQSRGDSEISFECLERCAPIALPASDQVASEDITDMGSLQIMSQEHLSSPEDELESNNNNPIPDYNVAEEVPFMNDLGSDIHGSSESYSFQQETSCQVACDTEILLPDMLLIESFQDKELKFGGDRHVSYLKGESGSNEDASVNQIENLMRMSGSLVSSQKSHSCFNPCSSADSVYDGSSAAKEKQSFLTTDAHVPADANDAVTSSSGTTFDDHDGLVAMPVHEKRHTVRLYFPPGRLLSTRKAISPSSQERLRQAADAEELCDDIGYSSLAGAKVSGSHDQDIQIPRNDRNESQQNVPKGILKTRDTSSVVSCDSGAECTPIHIRAQKAVTFTQLQMQGIESLAMKLVKELNCMKDIVEETLCSNACSSVSSKYTGDEIRMAVENASKVEETTNKWLSMMAKDCHRFCKIMGFSEKKTDLASECGAQKKKKKKIIFADEAGGMLCHVKVLDNCSASFLVPESGS